MRAKTSGGRYVTDQGSVVFCHIPTCCVPDTAEFGAQSVGFLLLWDKWKPWYSLDTGCWISPCSSESWPHLTCRTWVNRMPLCECVVWNQARGWCGRLLAISTQTDWAHACVSLSVEGSLPVSAHCPTTTLLMSLADCLAHTQTHTRIRTNTETIRIDENGTRRKWPEVLGPVLPTCL